MANNIGKLRGKHGITQMKLAELCGMTKQNMSLIENGRVSLKQAKAIAEILNENIFDVLGRDALVALPETEEDKTILINMIKEL